MLFGLYGLAQLVLAGEIEQVAACIELVAIVQDGVAGNVCACFRGEDDAYGGIIIGAPYLVVKHADIHVHLSDVLMGDGPAFEVREYVALKDDVVEDKVDVVVPAHAAQMVLASHKGITFAHLQEELLEVGEYGAFQVRFAHLGIG